MRFAALVLIASLVSCGEATQSISTTGAAVAPHEAIRGAALRPFARQPEDAVGLEVFSCEGRWMEQSRLRRVGSYVVDGATVCVQPNEGLRFCRQFSYGERPGTLVTDGVGPGGVRVDGIVEYSLTRTRDCE